MPLLLNDAPRGVDRWDSYQFSLFRGTVPWDGPMYEGLENCPMLCVSFANERDWIKRTTCQNEFWLYFQDRRSWKAAYRIARLLPRFGIPLQRDDRKIRVPGAPSDWLALVAFKSIGTDECVHATPEAVAEVRRDL